MRTGASVWAAWRIAAAVLRFGPGAARRKSFVERVAQISVVLGRLVFDRNQRGRVTRRLECLGDNKRDGLSAEMDLGVVERPQRAAGRCDRHRHSCGCESQHAGRFSCVMTSTTPGTASAALVSIDDNAALGDAAGNDHAVEQPFGRMLGGVARGARAGGTRAGRKRHPHSAHSHTSERDSTVDRPGKSGNGRSRSSRSLSLIPRPWRPTSGAVVGRNDRRSARSLHVASRSARANLPRHLYCSYRPCLQLHRRRSPRIFRSPPTHAVNDLWASFDTPEPQRYHPVRFK